jgi:hypothetical protein
MGVGVNGRGLDGMGHPNGKGTLVQWGLAMIDDLGGWIVLCNTTSTESPPISTISMVYLTATTQGRSKGCMWCFLGENPLSVLEAGHGE